MVWSGFLVLQFVLFVIAYMIDELHILFCTFCLIEDSLEPRVARTGLIFHCWIGGRLRVWSSMYTVLFVAHCHLFCRHAGLFTHTCTTSSCFSFSSSHYLDTMVQMDRNNDTLGSDEDGNHSLKNIGYVQERHQFDSNTEVSFNISAFFFAWSYNPCNPLYSFLIDFFFTPCSVHLNTITISLS